MKVRFATKVLWLALILDLQGAPLEQWASLKTGHHRAGIAFTAELEKKVG